LIFERVRDTNVICKRDNPELSVWWDGCGQANCLQGNEGYAKGRRLLGAELRVLE
jgi:hypothetical protein